MTPLLSTNRLMLVPYRAGMVTEQHISWLNDPETVKYSEQRYYKHTIETQHTYLNEFPVNSYIWLIQAGYAPEMGYDGLPGEMLPIGSITAFIDQHNHVANLGILLDKQMWGKGYGKEAWMTVMDHLFHNDIRKIECGCIATNLAMRYLARSCGMKEEAIIPAHFVVDGKIEDLVIYGRTWR